MQRNLHGLVGDLLATAGRGQYRWLRRILNQERPSAGLLHLERAGVLRLLPELEALVGVEQDPIWHPEGDAWVHTAMVVDEAARLCGGLSLREQELLMVAALCHDLGKPQTTERRDGRVRSFNHEPAGEPPTRALLGRLDAPSWLAPPVCALVRWHLAPVLFVKSGAKARAYRRLEQKLTAAGASVPLLLLLCRADQFGRTSPHARARRFDEGEAFEARWRASRLSTNGSSRSLDRPR
jgi:tRNA nucleotidyltransferase (CCA-adding enzyme)